MTKCCHHTFDRFCFGEAFDPRFFTSTHEPATREGWEPTGDFSGGNRVGGTQDPNLKDCQWFQVKWLFQGVLFLSGMI